MVRCDMAKTDRCPMGFKCPHWHRHEPEDECDTPSHCEDGKGEWFDIRCVDPANV